MQSLKIFTSEYETKKPAPRLVIALLDRLHNMTTLGVGLCFLHLVWSTCRYINIWIQGAGFSLNIWSQNTPLIWNMKIYSCLHKSRPLNRILSQMNPLYASTPYFPKTVLILLFHLHLGLPNGLFHSSFPSEILYEFPISSMSATYPFPFSGIYYYCCFTGGNFVCLDV